MKRFDQIGIKYTYFETPGGHTGLYGAKAYINSPRFYSNDSENGNQYILFKHQI